jgi:hypothetical protein
MKLLWILKAAFSSRKIGICKPLNGEDVAISVIQLCLKINKFQIPIPYIFQGSS